MSQKTIYITDTKPVSIDAPFTIRGVTLINETDQDFIAASDGGEEYPCPSKVIATWGTAPTSRIYATLVAAAKNGGNVRVVLTDQATQNTTAQLQTLAGSTAGGSKLDVIPLASWPPASPADGDSHWLELPVGDDVLGKKPRWLVTYNAASNFWAVEAEGIYGEASVGAEVDYSNTSYANNPALSIPIPLNGDYEVEVGAGFLFVSSVSGRAGSFIAYSGAGVTASDNDAASVQCSFNGAGMGGSGVRSRVKSLTAGTLSYMSRMNAGANAYGIMNAWIKATPIRLT